MAFSPFAHVAIQGVVQPDGKGVLGFHWDSLLTLMCGEGNERENNYHNSLKWKIARVFCLPKPSEKWVSTG